MLHRTFWRGWLLLWSCPRQVDSITRQGGLWMTTKHFVFTQMNRRPKHAVMKSRGERPSVYWRELKYVSDARQRRGEKKEKASTFSLRDKNLLRRWWTRRVQDGATGIHNQRDTNASPIRSHFVCIFKWKWTEWESLLYFAAYWCGTKATVENHRPGKSSFGPAEPRVLIVNVVKDFW